MDCDDVVSRVLRHMVSRDLLASVRSIVRLGSADRRLAALVRKNVATLVDRRRCDAVIEVNDRPQFDFRVTCRRCAAGRRCPQSRYRRIRPLKAVHAGNRRFHLDQARLVTAVARLADPDRWRRVLQRKRERDALNVEWARRAVEGGVLSDQGRYPLPEQLRLHVADVLERVDEMALRFLRRVRGMLPEDLGIEGVEVEGGLRVTGFSCRSSPLLGAVEAGETVAEINGVGVAHLYQMVELLRASPRDEGGCHAAALRTQEGREVRVRWRPETDPHNECLVMCAAFTAVKF